MWMSNTPKLYWPPWSFTCPKHSHMEFYHTLKICSQHKKMSNFACYVQWHGKMFQPKDLWQVLTDLRFYCTTEFQRKPVAPNLITPITVSHTSEWTKCQAAFLLLAGLWQHDKCSPAHTTPASSVCPQLCSPQPIWSHSSMEFSVPSHCTLSSQIRPIPCPNFALVGAPNAVRNPSCLQTTLALSKSQKSSQMVPHSPLYEISTRPSESFLPPESRRVTFGRMSAQKNKGRKSTSACTYAMTEPLAAALNWMGTLFSSHIARGKLPWDILTSRVFVSHKTDARFA